MRKGRLAALLLAASWALAACGGGSSPGVELQGIDPGQLSAWAPWTLQTQVNPEIEFEDGALSVELLSCEVHQPGIVSFEFELDEPDLDYPATLAITLSSSPSDFGVGVSQGDATIEGPGTFRVVAREAEFRRLIRAIGFDEDDKYGPVRLNRADPARSERAEYESFVAPGFGCNATLWLPDGRASDRLDARFVAASAPLVASAAGGTLQRYTQDVAAADAQLGPLVAMYGVGHDLFAERVFLTEAAGDLEGIRESIQHFDGCLRVEWTYRSATVVQMLRCEVTTPEEEVWEAGNSYFAYENTDGWDVFIRAVSENTRNAVAGSLENLENVETRPEPLWMLPPHVEMATADGEDGTLAAVVIGSIYSPCEGCGPDEWVYVYEIVHEEATGLAAYPFPGCLSVAEDEFTLAIAPRNGTLTVDGEEVRPFGTRQAAVLSPDALAEVRITLDSGDDEPRCLERFRNDTRGSDGPFRSIPRPDPAPDVTDVTGAACDLLGSIVRERGRRQDVYSTQALCTETPEGEIRVLRHTSTRPADDDIEKCIVVRLNGSNRRACETAADVTEMERLDFQGWTGIAVRVPDEATELRVVTELGEEIVGPAANGIGFVYWSRTQGEAVELFAVDGDGGRVLISLDGEPIPDLA